VTGGTPASPWLARIGLVAKAVFLLSLGALAARVAAGGSGSGDAGPQGAVELLARQRFGQVLLVLLLGGLACLVVWHAAQAVRGDPVEGSAMGDRIVYAAKVPVYLALAATAGRILALNWGRGVDEPAATGPGRGDEEREAAATVLSWPGGQWLMGGAGAALVAVAVVVAVRHTMGGRFLQRLDCGHRPWLERALGLAGRAGYAGRAAGFAIVGVLVVVAAARHDPAEAGGLSEALHRLAGEGWGRAVLWAIAAGFILAGAFSLAEARYRRRAGPA
jgi:hypothetical protein